LFSKSLGRSEIPNGCREITLCTGDEPPWISFEIMIDQKAVPYSVIASAYNYDFISL